MPEPEVLVIGDANPDLVLTGDVVPQFGQAEKLVDSADLVLGGSAAIVACGLARLGVPRRWPRSSATTCSALRARRAGRGRSRHQVDPSPTRHVPTAVSVVLSAGDRAILTYPGTLGATGPESSTSTC